MSPAVAALRLRKDYSLVPATPQLRLARERLADPGTAYRVAELAMASDIA
jgi:predicted ATPase